MDNLLSTTALASGTVEPEKGVPPTVKTILGEGSPIMWGDTVIGVEVPLLGWVFYKDERRE